MAAVALPCDTTRTGHTRIGPFGSVRSTCAERTNTVTTALPGRRTMISALLVLTLCSQLIAGSASATDTSAPSPSYADVVAHRKLLEHAAAVDALLSEPSRVLSTAGDEALRWPVEGSLTSPFGSRSGRMHRGIDVAAPVGTPVHAVQDGTVAFAGWKGGYGNTVDIDHGGGQTSRSAHQSELLVHTGEHVERGQVIGHVGTTGSSTGPHVHFELRVDGTDLDPLDALPADKD